MKKAGLPQTLPVRGRPFSGMKKRFRVPKEGFVFRGPYPFVAAFYAFLAAWTGLAVWFLAPHAFTGTWPAGHLLMIAFVVGYSWYFSLGIAHEVEIQGDGEVLIKSYRRSLKSHALQIASVEGPRFSFLPWGFIRMRVKAEKIYVFSWLGGEELGRLLSTLKTANREMEIKFLVHG
jgi:hypothetical protein